MTIARLGDRGVVSVSGAEARAFLDRLVTCDMDGVRPDQARFGALLTPQGKIIADFVIYVVGDDASETFLLDTPVSCVPELTKRLTLYRLRAKLSIMDRSAEFAVVVGWGTDLPVQGVVSASDPRLPDLGWRAIVVASEAPSPSEPAEASYHLHRIALGMPEAVRDFAVGDAFPHEALMDQLAGVDFDKGCYVGQEVVSRMQHRGTARTRIVPLLYEGAVAAPGTEILAGDKTVGRTGSAGEGRGLAMIRLDRVADAVAAGQPILAAGEPVRLEKPGWIRFPFPGDVAAVPS